MAIRAAKIYIRFAILVLFAGFFSSNSFAIFDGLSHPYTGTACFVSSTTGAHEACAGIAAGYITRKISEIQSWQADAVTVPSAGQGTCKVIDSTNVQAPHTEAFNPCDRSCLSGNIRDANGNCAATPTCPSGQTFDGYECVWITSCPAGQSLFQTTTAGGVPVSAQCVPQVATPQQKCISYDDMQTTSCQTQSAACTSTGGTFGSVNGTNVCVPAGNNLPTCASGATKFQTNSDGSSTPTCVGTANIGNGGDNTASSGDTIKGNDTSATSQNQSSADTANNTAAIAHINASGFQAVVNAINNNTSKAGGGGGSGGSTAAQDQGNTAGIISAINANTSSEHGAGVCDPHSANYSTCIQQSETAPDADGSSIRSGAISAGNASIDSASETVVTGINAAASQAAPDTSTISGTLLSYLQVNDSCSDFHTTIKGVAFNVNCSDTSLFREWASWALAIGTMYGIFLIMFKRSTA